ncbi:MAG TPA: threonine synthase [candidate division Zixibacteria bacterium]|nr:threonine synthase [candidate division Zixibacteria bacterium]
MYLRCHDRECGATLDLHDRALECPKCGGLLEVAVDEMPLLPEDLKALWRERRMSRDPRDVSGVWRYREFLPAYEPEQIVTLGEGNTALVRGKRTADWAGVHDLQFKHLGWNPTACFKDLGMTTGMTEACRAGAQVVACASTGNTAASMAAYAARADVVGRVYLPAGQVSLNKLAQALDYGAEIVEVEGSFDDALNTLLATAGDEVYFLNSINPFRVEGQKTTMFDLLDQLNWQSPDYLIVPGGNLGNSAAFGKAFEELLRFGLIDRAPKMIVVQAAGANPFARMWQTGANELIPVAEPETAATAIRIGNPRSWKKSLRGVQLTGGCVLDVTEGEIAEAKSVIGRDGIGCEPASAVTLAGLRKMRRAGTIAENASVVAILTGHVLKDTNFIIKHAEKKEHTHVG